MPRRNQNRQFVPASLEDILAGRVDNGAFLDIDHLPTDAPAIAPEFVANGFVPTSFDEILDGTAADGALMGFDARRDDGVPTNDTGRPRTVQEIRDSLRDNPLAAFNFSLSEEREGLQAQQKRRQREGLPRSEKLQRRIDRMDQHIRGGLSPSEFNDPEQAIREGLGEQPEALRDFDRRKELREINEEMKERRALGLPTLERHVRRRRLLERSLRRPISDGSDRAARPVNENIKNVIPTPAINPLLAVVKGGIDSFTFGTDDEVSTAAATPFIVAARAVSGADAGKGLSERVMEAFNREVTRQRLLKEEAQRQQPLAFGLGSGVGFVPKLAKKSVALATQFATKAASVPFLEQSPELSPTEIDQFRNRIENKRAKAGGELDRELKTLRRNLTREDGSPQTSRPFIKTVLQNIKDRRELPFTDPNAISPTTYRNLLPLIRQLENQLQ